MKAKLPLIARILLGFVMAASGLAGLLGFAKPPPDVPQNMQLFMTGMMATGYLFPLVKITETVCGLLLLSGFYVPLALVMLAPVMVNIFFVNAFMMPSGLPIVFVLGALQIYLSFFSPYSPPIKTLFRAK
ncbi:MAG: DoxX family membrane protein [Proteobacteria bacterium]|nr:MAG: DoxX family membrane protein [Pseudomonadota bacterium]